MIEEVKNISISLCTKPKNVLLKQFKFLALHHQNSFPHHIKDSQMELELGLKLTRSIDEFTSTDFRITKNRAGPVFVSNETDKMFILSAHLKGYRKGSIKIEINEDGTCIAISGEKQVQETIIVGWEVQKKGVEMKRFRKAFKIPDGVVLDKIEAKFNEVESVLTITMPKKAKGIRGKDIEEVIEEENIARRRAGTMQVVDDETSPGESSKQRKGKGPEAICTAESDVADEKFPEMRKIDSSNEPVVYDQKEKEKKEDQLVKNTLPETAGGENNHLEENAEGTTRDQLTQNAEAQKLDKQEIDKDIQETSESRCDHGDSSCSKKPDDQRQRNDNQQNGEEDQGNAKEAREGEFPKRGEPDVPERRSLICAPIVAGSAILVSLVVFVFQLIRSKNQAGKRQN